VGVMAVLTALLLMEKSLLVAECAAAGKAWFAVAGA
jgi:hypothetical protein